MHFFPTNCITDAMVKGLIDKDEQCNMFSVEILAHFKNDDDNASRSLADIELAFFPICVSNHFYAVVFNIKKSLTTMIILDNSDSGTYNSKYKGVCELLKKFFSRFLQEHNHQRYDVVSKVRGRVPRMKWKTKSNHVDCGVFAMIHMESYVGDPAAKWDVGLCAESE